MDIAAKAVVTTIEQENLIPVTPILHNANSPVDGAAQLAVHRYDPNTISMLSDCVLINYAAGLSHHSHTDYTPIARLVSVYYGVFVKWDSLYTTLEDLIEDVKNSPGKSSMAGGPIDDHVCLGLLFSKAGIDLNKIDYQSFSGGLEASRLVLENSSKALVTAVDDVIELIEERKLRPLAISSEERMGDILADYPTFRQAGVELAWENFRLVVGGPNMSANAVESWQDVFSKMVRTPTWQNVLQKYRWVDAFKIEDLQNFLEEKQTLTNEVVPMLGIDFR